MDRSRAHEKQNPIGKMAIDKCFFACYAGSSRSELARFFRVGKAAVTQWANKGTIPWSKLKFLSDSQGISCDWLIDRITPKCGKKAAKKVDSRRVQFSTAGSNRRFLSLYNGISQTEIANTLFLSTSTVNDWTKNKRRIGWERLQDAVHSFSVSWDWLIDGVEPKYLDGVDGS